MRTIYKYMLNVGTTEIELPSGYKILKVATLEETHWIWIEVEVDNPIEVLKIITIGTGHFLGDSENVEYIDTVFEDIFGQILVWHLYKVLD